MLAAGHAILFGENQRADLLLGVKELRQYPGAQSIGDERGNPCRGGFFRCADLCRDAAGPVETLAFPAEIPFGFLDIRDQGN